MSELQAGRAGASARDLEATGTGKGSKGPTRRQALLGGGAAMAVAAGMPLSLGGLSPSPALANGTTPPNIVYIIADDLGFADVGFHGSDIRTPNLDRLAETGVTFDAFYTQPMCTPTRAAFLTGRYPCATGCRPGSSPRPAPTGWRSTSTSCLRS